MGYLEKDQIRGEDSTNTFEEILSIAKEEKVDFLLHCGDIFHDNKPSRKILFKTMDLLRKYSLGDDPVLFQVMSDQKINFPTTFDFSFSFFASFFILENHLF